PFVARRGRDAARAVSTGRPSGMSPALNSWPRHYGGLSACGVGGGRVEAARAAEPRRRRTRCRLPSRSILRRRGDLVFGATVNLTKGIIGRLAREAADLGQPVVSCGGEEEEEEEEDSLYVSVVWCSSTVGGLGLGLVSLVATGFLALLGFLAIGYACRHTGARTYREACVRSAGVHPLLVDVMVVLECIITNVGYTLLILDYANIGLNGLFGLPVNRLSRTLLAVLITASAILPLSLKENLYSLRFSSLLGVFAVGYALVFVIADSATQESCWDFFDGASFVGSEREGIFRAVSIMTSALSFHYNAPTIWAELSDHPSQWNAFVTASILSFSICTVIYVAFSIAGLACFGSTVQGNVLMGYQPGVLVLLAWIAQSVNLTVCFPLVFKPARDTLMQSVGFPPPSSQGQAERCSAGSALPHALPVDRVDGRGRPVRGGRRDDPHRHLPGAGVPRRSAGGPPLLHASRPHARLPGERSAAEDCRGGAPGAGGCSAQFLGPWVCSVQFSCDRRRCMLVHAHRSVIAYSLVRITW
ncbi:unnamed protein product, partial [Prorocentrum cordatum]